ncbi:hypothetical protein O181_031378 [Austropuccinia psidii MF-1]|uniref:Uncharacterized protein n=1 Tax=Austropuccinia psidii MF-1 TaxID=1389203 RepID=A0A9Q3H4J5_9BASI|nr:hypothetical protein [Austropuccinia psidii MF-1]
MKVITIWGDNSIYSPLKVLNMGLQSTRHLLFSSGEVTLLYSLGPPTMGPKASIWSLGLPGTPAKLFLGDSKSPHGPRTVKTPIWPKFQGHQELAIDLPIQKMEEKRHFGTITQGIWEQDPSFQDHQDMQEKPS